MCVWHPCLFTIQFVYVPFKKFYFNTAFNEWLLLGHLVTARASDKMFLCIDFVHVTNCAYDYDYDYDYIATFHHPCPI